LLKNNIELWNLFTRKEEYNPLILDRFKRFSHYQSQNRSIMNPLVTNYLKEKGWNIIYPDNKKFGVCLTHDIDSLYIPNMKKISHMYKSLKKTDFKEVIKTPFYNYVRKWNPLWNFNDMIKLESKYEAKSSFYFLVLEENDKGYNYDIDKHSKVLEKILENGNEIGLHIHSDTFNKKEKIIQKKKYLEKILNKEVIGCRTHYLKFKVPDTWEILFEAGFKYDTSFGYADSVGFRNGCCHPFYPYNLDKQTTIPLLEIPLTIMDVSLFEYMRLDVQSAWSLIKQLIDTVKKNNGVITILWHNGWKSYGDIKTDLMLYEKILKYCSNNNAWITNAKEIYDFWNTNELA